ncbi:MAG: DUF5674 family protein [Candidatus Falkowbacteria bacterium]
MQIIKNQIKLSELKEMARKMFGDLVKAVVDVEKRIMAVDGELHADEEGMLLQNGSKQASLWGINIYPELYGSKDFIEFDSMINLRPSQANRSLGVENPETQKIILEITNNLIANDNTA